MVIALSATPSELSEVAASLNRQPRGGVYRALWIRLEEFDPLIVLDRRDCKSDGQRTLAASALLRDQSKDVQNWALPDSAA